MFIRRCLLVVNAVRSISDTSLRSKATVLVVDDDRGTLALFARFISAAGMDPIKALSAAECFQIVQQRPIDLIILDLLMPGIDGIDALKELEKRCAGRKPPILGVTSWCVPAVGPLVKSLGAAEVLFKPVFRREFLDRVTMLIERGWKS